MVPRGVLLVDILTEGDPPATVATMNNLKAFIETETIPFTCLIDPTPLGRQAAQPNMQNYFDLQRGDCVIIYAPTGVVLEKFPGNPAWGGSADQASRCMHWILSQPAGQVPAMPWPPPC